MIFKHHTVKQELLHDEITLKIAEGDTELIKACLDIAYSQKDDVDKAQMYTICRYLVHLTKTFCKPPYEVSNILDNMVIQNFLALSLENKLTEAVSLAYTDEFIKEYLKCSNTMLYLADKMQLGCDIDKAFYDKCKEKMLSLMVDVPKRVAESKSKFLDKNFWITYLEKINDQVRHEIRYFVGTESEPSIRMQANRCISLAEYKGIQAELDYNQTYKLGELV